METPKWLLLPNMVPLSRAESSPTPRWSFWSCGGGSRPSCNLDLWESPRPVVDGVPCCKYDWRQGFPCNGVGYGDPKWLVTVSCIRGIRDDKPPPDWIFLSYTPRICVPNLQTIAILVGFTIVDPCQFNYHVLWEWLSQQYECMSCIYLPYP